MTATGRVLLFENSRSLAINMGIVPVMARSGVHGTVVSLSTKRHKLYRKADISSIHLDAISIPAAIVFRGEELGKLLEDRFPDFRLDLAIRRDRFLRWRSFRKSRAQLLAAMARFDELIDELHPSLVVGEVSTALEYALSFVSEARGIPYRHLLNLSTRKPRITLFDYSHSAESTLYVGEGQGNGDSAGFDINYFDLGTRRKQGHSQNWVLWRDLIRTTYSRQDYRTSFSYKLRYLVRLLYVPCYWLIERLFGVDIDQAKGGALLALHVQPESTPDFVSIFFADQIQLAERIAEGLPSAIPLVIKEHPHLLSLRNPLRFIALLRRRNVRLLKRKVSLREVFPQLDSLITIAGTVAVEAASFGTPTIVYSSSFLRGLPNVLDGRNYKSFADAYFEIKKRRRAKLATAEIEAYLDRLGTPGLIYDWPMMPEILDQNYLDAIAFCIIRFLTLADARKIAPIVVQRE